MRAWPWWFVVAVGCPAPGAEFLEDNDGDGASEVDGDCNDEDGSVGPNAPEVCNSVDDNCTGGVDEGLLTEFFADSDEDGHGDPQAPLLACELPAGASRSADDCFPADDLRWDRPVYEDLDGDGFGSANEVPEGALACDAPETSLELMGYDCDDDDDTIHDGNESFPAAPEICDGKDNDCDLAVDDDDDDAVVDTTFYVDADLDGFPSATTEDRCDGGPGWIDVDAGVQEDCDDVLASVNPGAVEACSPLGVDDDCDGFIDDEDFIDQYTPDATIFFGDSDNDLLGDDAQLVYRCEGDIYFVTVSGDCDDLNDRVQAPPTPQWADVDGDGYGDPNDRLADSSTCAADLGVQNDADCQDAVPGIPSYLDDCRTPGPDETCGEGPRAGGCASMASVLFPIPLNEPTQGLGGRVSSGGDLDGDGLEDVIVGTYRSSQAQDDQLSIFFQTPAAWATGNWAADRVTDDYNFTNRSALYGLAADLTGDGVDDLLAVDHNPADAVPGALWIVPGPLTRDDGVLSRATAIPFDTLATGNLGGFAAVTGDLDGDNLDDLVLTAPNITGSAGDQLFVVRGGTSPSALSDPSVDTLVNTDDYVDGIGMAVAYTDDLGTGVPGIALLSGGLPQDGIEVVVIAGDQLIDGAAITANPYAWFETSDADEAAMGARPSDVLFADLDNDGTRNDLIFSSADPDEVPSRATVYVFRDLADRTPAVPEAADGVADAIVRLPDRSCSTALEVVGSVLVVSCPDPSNTQGHTLALDLAGVYGNVVVDASTVTQYTSPSFPSYPGSSGMTTCDVGGTQTVVIGYADTDVAMSLLVP